MEWSGVRWVSLCTAGRFYLRKYQASSAMMSSSRDRTSTVGRMWWLGEETSSEEEGEAEPGVREHRQQKKQEEGARPKICVHMFVCKCVAEFTCFSHVYIALTDQTKSILDSSHILFWSQA